MPTFYDYCEIKSSLFVQLKFLSLFLTVLTVTTDASPAASPNLGHTGSPAGDRIGRQRRSAEEVSGSCFRQITDLSPFLGETTAGDRKRLDCANYF